MAFSNPTADTYAYLRHKVHQKAVARIDAAQDAAKDTENRRTVWDYNARVSELTHAGRHIEARELLEEMAQFIRDNPRHFPSDGPNSAA